MAGTANVKVILSAVDRASGEINQAQNKINQSMQKTGQQMRKAGMAMTAAGAAGLMASEKLTNSAMEITEGYREVTTLLDNSESAMEDYQDQIQRISKEYAVSGGEAETTAGLYQVLSAGIEEGSAAMEVLEASAAGARAGLAKTDTVVDGVTTVLNAYKMETKEASRVTDVLYAGVQEGKMRMNEISQSIGAAVPMASKLGVSIEQVTGAMVTLTKSGIKANTATRGLRMIMSQMLSPSARLKEEVAKLGYESASAMVRSEGLQKSLDMLYGSVEGNNQAMAEMIPSSRALSMAMNMVGESADGAQKDLKNVSNSAGVTKEAVDTMSDSNSAKLKKVDERLRQINTTMGQSTAPKTIYLKEKMADLGEELVKLDEKTGGLLGATFTLGSAFMAMVGPLMSVIGQYMIFRAVQGQTISGMIIQRALAIKNAIANKLEAVSIKAKAVALQSYLVGVWTAIGAKAKQMAATLAGVKAHVAETAALGGKTVALIASSVAGFIAAAAQWALNTAMYACPIVWIIALIIGLIAILYLLVKHFDKVKGAVMKLWEGLKKAWEKIKGFFSWIREVVFKVLSAFANAFGRIKDVVVDAFKSLGSSIKSFFTGMISKFFNFGVRMAKSLADGISDIFGWFASLPGKLYKKILKLIEKAKEWGKDFISEFISGVWNGIKRLGGKIKDGLKDAIGFDVRANDRMAEGWGADAMEYFSKGAESKTDEVKKAMKEPEKAMEEGGEVGVGESRGAEVKEGEGGEKKVSVSVSFDGLMLLNNKRDRKRLVKELKNEIREVA